MGEKRNPKKEMVFLGGNYHFIHRKILTYDDNLTQRCSINPLRSFAKNLEKKKKESKTEENKTD